MNRTTASEELRRFFSQQLEYDANATLLTAKHRLDALHESGPDDEELAPLEQWQLETSELIRVHGGHCSLRDLLRAT